MGSDHPDLSIDRAVPSCRAADLVVSVAADLLSDFLHHHLHRYRKTIRQRRRLRSGINFLAVYFLPDARIRKRTISRRSAVDSQRLSESYFAQFGLRFSLNAAMPSRASADS